MRVAGETTDQLVLTDAGAPIRGFGIFLAAFGALWFYASSRGAALPLFPLIIGTFAVLAGLAAVILPSRVTATFDKPSRTLAITRRSLRASTRDEIDLARIASVESERSPGGRGMTTWRVAVILRDGTRVPVTNYYSNSPGHALAAKAARDFLSLSDPAPDATTDGASAAFAAVPALRPIGKGIFVAFGLMCAVFIGIGGWALAREAHQFRVSRPTDATVLATRTEMKRGSGRNTSVTYVPVVTYRYTVNGRQYISTRVTPLNESRSGSWADKLIARYPVGSAATAWYDPDHPEQAFLLHEWSLLPAFFIAFPLLTLLFLTTIARRWEGARSPAARPNSI